MQSQCTQKSTMHPEEFNNWVKVKNSLEESGKTDNMFYERSCAIVKTKQDPLAQYLGDVKTYE